MVNELNSGKHMRCKLKQLEFPEVLNSFLKTDELYSTQTDGQLVSKYVR